jgi:hypothetical protein
VDDFGPSCRREGLEASLEPRLHLIEVHDVEANPSSRRRRRGAGLRVAVIQSAPWLGDLLLSRCDRIAELAQTLAPLLEDAADAGARKSGGMEFVGRGRGFTDSDPTGTAPSVRSSSQSIRISAKTRLSG